MRSREEIEKKILAMASSKEYDAKIDAEMGETYNYDAIATFDAAILALEWVLGKDDFDILQ